MRNNLQQLLRQSESLLNKGEVADVLSKGFSELPDEPGTTLPERIDKLRGELFGLQVKVAVTRDTLDDQRTVLDRVCNELDAVATELETVQVQLSTALVSL